ncbi:MAG: hypothetical protein Q4C56_00235 [Peptococcaceae bacterium]|nr:hypothetical protein [Peptococcaceae bacterium]
MTLMVSISWVGVMLLVGVVLRALIKPLGNILMPACVIGGIVGFILMNVGLLPKLGVDYTMMSSIVSNLFTLSFISMGLTATPKTEGVNSGKETVRGSAMMGLAWSVLYGLQPVVAFAVLMLIGGFFSMAPEYGLQIPFAFCQGPGQSATYGGMIEAGGLMPGAQQVGITFAVLGFIWAFAVGVPMAKRGMRNNMATYPRDISDGIKRGILEPAEQTQSAGKMTTYSGNIDALAFNFALVGLGYAITAPVCAALRAVPNAFISTFGAMEFFMGLFVGYAIKFIMTKAGVKKYHDDALQTRITGWGTDFMICAAFMAVQLAVIGQWLVPIIITCAVVGLVTFFVCLYFSSHLGGAYDFERFLGLYGTATGTCPSGVALIRIVDPELRTTASAECGAMNAFMFSGYIAPFVVMYCVGTLGAKAMIGLYAIAIFAPIVGLFVFRLWHRKPSFSLLKKERYLTLEDFKQQNAE